MLRKVALLTLLLTGCTTVATPKADEPLTTRPEPIDTATETPNAFRCDAPQEGWTTFQGNSQRTGNTEAEPIARPTVRWSVPLGIASWLNNPVVAGETVYLGTSGQIWNEPDGGDGVVALGLADGSRRWFFTTDADVNGVTYSGCRVFATTENGAVFALDAANGKALWKHRRDGVKFYTNPLVVGGVVVVGDGAGTLWALDVATGADVWKKRFSGALRGGVAAHEGVVYAASQAREVAAIDAASGDVVWSSKIVDAYAKEVYASPTVLAEHGAVVVSYARDTSYEEPALVAFDIADGSEKWVGSNPDGLGGGWGNIRSSPAVLDGNLVYAEPYSNRLVTVDGATGAATASVAAGACTFPHWPSPAVAGSTLYVPRHDGALYAFADPRQGPTWSLFLGDAERPALPVPDEVTQANGCSWDGPIEGSAIFASPAVAADGTVIVATGQGYVFAIAPAR